MTELVKKLEACPFCGFKHIDLWPMKSLNERPYRSPICNRCGATINENYGTEETTEAMVKAWNRRVASDGLRERIEELCQYAKKRTDGRKGLVEVMELVAALVGEGGKHGS